MSPIPNPIGLGKNHDGWKRGIRVGNVGDGTVTAFIPDPVEKTTGTAQPKASWRTRQVHLRR